jgi:maleate cis-trans isomerase
MTARVGLIIPSSNRMVEQEMVRFFPPGVHAHVMRLRMTGPHHVPLAALLPRVEEAAHTLMDAKCDVVVFHCTAASMEAGLAGEQSALVAVARAGAPHATTTATAIRRVRRARCTPHRSGDTLQCAHDRGGGRVPSQRRLRRAARGRP